MKKIIAAVAALSLVGAATAFAVGPETIDLKASMGTVKFPHKAHQEMKFEKGCKTCHEKAPGKIEGLNKDWAHATCKGCHTDMKKGPTGCKDCHKK